MLRNFTLIINSILICVLEATKVGTHVAADVHFFFLLQYVTVNMRGIGFINAVEAIKIYTCGKDHVVNL